MIVRWFQVLWVEQQFSKQRSKRAHHVNYNDPSWSAEWYIVSNDSGLVKTVSVRIPIHHDRGYLALDSRAGRIYRDPGRPVRGGGLTAHPDLTRHRQRRMPVGGGCRPLSRLACHRCLCQRHSTASPRPSHRQMLYPTPVCVCVRACPAVQCAVPTPCDLCWPVSGRAEGAAGCGAPARLHRTVWTCSRSWNRASSAAASESSSSTTASSTTTPTSHTPMWVENGHRPEVTRDARISILRNTPGPLFKIGDAVA